MYNNQQVKFFIVQNISHYFCKQKPVNIKILCETTKEKEG